MLLATVRASTGLRHALTFQALLAALAFQTQRTTPLSMLNSDQQGNSLRNQTIRRLTEGTCDKSADLAKTAHVFLKHALRQRNVANTRLCKCPHGERRRSPCGHFLPLSCLISFFLSFFRTLARASEPVKRRMSSRRRRPGRAQPEKHTVTRRADSDTLSKNTEG